MILRKTTLTARINEALALHNSTITDKQAKVKGEVFLKAHKATSVQVFKVIGDHLINVAELATKNNITLDSTVIKALKALDAKTVVKKTTKQTELFLRGLKNTNRKLEIFNESKHAKVLIDLAKKGDLTEASFDDYIDKVSEGNAVKASRIENHIAADLGIIKKYATSKELTPVIVTAIYKLVGVKEANKAALGDLEGLGATAKTKNSVRWNKLIIDAKRNGFKPDDIFELGQPNGIVKKYVGKNVITLSGAVITKSMNKDGDHIAEWHHFINLPDQINKPIAIFESKSKGFVLLIPVITYKNKPLMMSLHIDKSLKVTRIASIYNRKRFNTYKEWVDNGLMKYQEKNNGIFDYQTATIAEGSKTPYTKVTNSNNNSKKPLGNTPETKELPLETKPTQPVEPTIPGTSTAADLANKPFNPLVLPYKWKKIIGDFELPNHFLLTGAGGSGKSGMALEFLNDLTKIGYKGLYASREQYYRPTFGKLIRDVGIDIEKSPIVFSPDYENESINPGMFDVVVLDSKDDFDLTRPEDFRKLTFKYPNTSFIILSQATKKGEFSGSGKWRNVVDTMLDAYERGKMRTGAKNRWDQFGEITLFETEQEPIAEIN